MSVYSTGAEAFRDTTKWLVAFVPTATIIGAGAVIGGRLTGDAAASDSILLWAFDNARPLVGIGLSVIGVALVIFYGARVLSTQPKDFSSLLSTDDKALSEAFSAGVGTPYFLDDRTFREAIADLHANWANEDIVTDAEVSRAVAATDMLRGWALHRALAMSFATFQRAFGAGILLIVGGLVLTTITVEPEGGTIDQPTLVSVEMQEAGAKDLLDATGCKTPVSTEFLAIAGTWDAPVLAVEGASCRFGARWRPESKLVAVRLPS